VPAGVDRLPDPERADVVLLPSELTAPWAGGLGLDEVGGCRGLCASDGLTVGVIYAHDGWLFTDTRTLKALLFGALQPERAATLLRRGLAHLRRSDGLHVLPMPIPRRDLPKTPGLPRSDIPRLVITDRPSNLSNRDEPLAELPPTALSAMRYEEVLFDAVSYTEFTGAKIDTLAQVMSSLRVDGVLFIRTGAGVRSYLPEITETLRRHGAGPIELPQHPGPFQIIAVKTHQPGGLDSARPAERALLAELDGDIRLHELKRGPPYRVDVEGRGVSVYKADFQASAEVGAYRLAEELGWEDLIPVTTMWLGPMGLGSAQRWLHGTTRGDWDISRYRASDRERAAVLDYVMANSDRHRGNYLGYGSILRLIDHGLAFDPKEMVIVSPFVVHQRWRALSGDVLADVRRVIPERLATRLHAAGLGSYEVETALARLREISELGTITGRAWQTQRRAIWHGPEDTMQQGIVLPVRGIDPRNGSLADVAGYELRGRAKAAFEGLIRDRLGSAPRVDELPYGERGPPLVLISRHTRDFGRFGRQVVAYTWHGDDGPMIVMFAETYAEIRELRAFGLAEDFLERVLAFEVAFRIRGGPEEGRRAQAKALIDELNQARVRRQLFGQAPVAGGPTVRPAAAAAP
jgi:hypothetical protein